MKWLYALVVFLVLLSWCCNASDKLQTIYVSTVYDGDTFYDEKGKPYRVADIDCPEIGQLYGEQAKRFTDSLIGHKIVEIKILGKDPFCRTICRVYIGSIDLGTQLVRNGYAWVYRKYASDYMYGLYVFAKRRQIGMWARKDNDPPFAYRGRIKNSMHR